MSKEEKCLQFFGDSWVVIDRFFGIDILHNLALYPWQQRIFQLQEFLKELEVSHIQREQNVDVDRRSKEALLQPVGHLVIS